MDKNRPLEPQLGEVMHIQRTLSERNTRISPPPSNTLIPSTPEVRNSLPTIETEVLSPPDTSLHYYPPPFPASPPCQSPPRTVSHLREGPIKQKSIYDAIWDGDENLVRYLLQKHLGANVNCRNSKRQTPLFVAAAKGNTKLASMLLEWSPNIETRDENERTALHIAAGLGHGEVVRLLLEKGADREAKDTKGMKPVDYARKFGAKETARLLEGDR
jgi:ankyrin repeat protein